MRNSSQPLLSVLQGSGPLYLQIYHRIRALVLSGAWPPGTQLPSSRALARDLGISRNTAILAIDKLMSDGWIISRTGSGIYVSSEAPPSRPPLPSGGAARAPSSVPVPFEIAHAATDVFPVAAWSKIQSKVWTNAAAEALHEGSGAGWAPLRNAIASYLHAVRGIACSPDQILVVSSSQSALDLCIRALARQGDEIWVEDPGYPYAREAFQAHGLEQVTVPVDGEGIDVARGIGIAGDARLAYVTPACQFPTCSILSAARRKLILDWAARTGNFIIEDDWDFNAILDTSQPADPLAASGSEQVLHIHSFNRLLFPALRIAALVVPAPLVDRFLSARRTIDGFPNVPNQIALTEFMDQGLLSSHLRRCRMAFEERRAALHAAAREHLSRWMRIDETRPGLHALAWTDYGDSELATIARNGGIACLGVSDFKIAPSPFPGALLLGCAAFKPEAIRGAAKRLADLLAHSLEGTR